MADSPRIPHVLPAPLWTANSVSVNSHLNVPFVPPGIFESTHNDKNYLQLPVAIPSTFKPNHHKKNCDPVDFSSPFHPTYDGSKDEESAGIWGVEDEVDGEEAADIDESNMSRSREQEDSGEEGEDDDDDEDEDSDDEAFLMEERQAPVFTEMDTPEGFVKLALSACNEIGLPMTETMVANMSNDDVSVFYERIAQTKVFRAAQEQNFTLRRKALKESPSKLPWSKKIRDRMMDC
ncbi:hypothetical protein BJ508DRAFT_336560 [Ascobolus immersus RN42]|uniref:Uncharacterized protein n=1 Tax=Ascobolus immersus RN42 TaxID=1160509 RepID=A0A3N4H826_ASCIM|nr:hypothetical protein BJ508DRAFT_336560 [Ascobolus immersus RN42]